MDHPKRLIKKYSNRRLYDTVTSAYITVDDARYLIQNGADIQVIDAKTGEDITRSILLQIVVEAETGDTPIFSSEVLVKLIHFYGQDRPEMMSRFLEMNIQLLFQLQQQMREKIRLLNGEDSTLSNKLWNDFLSMQGPAMLNLMSSYLDQNAQLYLNMQQQMQEQTKQIFAVPHDPALSEPDQKNKQS